MENADRATERDSRGGRLNALTIVFLILTVCMAGFYCLLLMGVVRPPGPFAPVPPPTLYIPPTPTETLTPTPTVPPPTPTSTPTRTPTPTRTRTPTPTPSPTLTWPPTDTPAPTETLTPEATRSLRPYTYEVELRQPMYGCGWTGVAGHVQDFGENPNPIVGLPVRVWGAGIDATVMAGAETKYVTMYGWQSAWEMMFDVRAKQMEIHVQLYDNQGRPVSEDVVISMPGFCGNALAYVTFTKNPNH